MYGGLMFAPLHAHGAAARMSASAAEGAARQARSDVELLKADVERLLMIAEALWAMLKEQHGYTDDDLVARIGEIDMRDGKLDGRVAPSGPPAACPECGRALSKKRPVCIYCGTVVAPDPFER